MTRITAKPAGVSDTVAAHVAAFDEIADRLPGAGDAAVQQLRAEALTRFAEAGIPSRRLEDWKFTGLDALTRAVFAPPPASAPVDLPPRVLDVLAPVADAVRLVFINGAFQPRLSAGETSDDVTVRPLAAGIAAPHELSAGDDAARALVALNAAFMSDGVVIELGADRSLDKPVVAIFLTSGGGTAVHVRNVVRLGPHARATLIEVHATLPGLPAAFANTVTDVSLADGSALWHGRIATEAMDALHHHHTRVNIGANADYGSLALSVGGALTRQESDVAFVAPGGRARLFGAYLVRGHQHMDHTTRVRHDHPGCTTEELFKGVMEDRGHGVFQGLVHVAPLAVRTDAQQKNTNLLLSDRAVADSKPELEILADDVKCSHGATIGDLDPDEIFYLRARGIDPDAARRLLLTGYVEDVIARIDDKSLAAVARAHAERWLAGEAL